MCLRLKVEYFFICLIFFWLPTLSICSIPSHCQEACVPCDTLEAFTVQIFVNKVVVKDTMSGKDTTFRDRGSGVIISETGEVVTAYHVIKDAVSGYIRFPKKYHPHREKEIQYIVAKDTNELVDLVLLSVEDEEKRFRAARLCYLVKTEDPIKIYGFPLMTLSDTSFSCEDPKVSTTELPGLIGISEQLWGGWSGAPVFNCEGEMVAIVKGKDIFKNGSTGMNYMVVASKVDSLRRHKLPEPISLIENKCMEDAIWANTAKGHYSSGDDYYKRGKYKKALPHLKEVLKRGRGDPAVMWAKIGFCYHKLDAIEAAIDASEEALEIKEDYYEAWRGLGYLYKKQNRRNEAIQAYEKAWHIHPESFVTAYNLGELLLFDKQYTKATDILRIAITTYDERCSLRKQLTDACKDSRLVEEAVREFEKEEQRLLRKLLARAYKDSGLVEDAEREFQVVISLDSTDWSSYGHLAEIYDELGYSNQAKMYRKKAQKCRPLQRMSPEIAFSYASIFERNATSGFRSALKHYEEAVQDNSCLTAAFKGICRIYRMLTCYQQSCELLKDTITIFETSDNTVRLDLDTCFLTLSFPLQGSSLSCKNYDHGVRDEGLAVECCQKAVTCYQWILEDNPTSVDALFNLGRIYIILGDFINALDVYAKLRTMDEALAKRLLMIYWL